VAWADDDPAGAWKPCGDGCLERGKSRIETRSQIDEEKLVAALKGEVVHDEDIEIGGKKGRLIVTFGDALEATAILGTDAISLRAPLDEAGAAAHAWSAIIQRLGAGAPDAAGGSLKLVNVDTDCAATVYVDGQAHTLAAGASEEITLPSARAFVEWQERDGDHRMAAATPGAEARVGCPPPKQEAALVVPPQTAVSVDAAPAAPVVTADAAPVAAFDAAVPTSTDNADASGGPRASLEPAFAGARSAVLFYRGLWSVVLDGKMWEAPRSLDRLMLKLLQHRPRDRWDNLAAYTALHEQLERAVTNAANDPAKMTQLRRVATELMMSTAQVGSQRGCATVQDAAMTPEAKTEALDCASNRISRMGTSAKDVLGLRMLNAAALDPPSGDVAARLAELAK
jgi:hypothetical protein